MLSVFPRTKVVSAEIYTFSIMPSHQFYLLGEPASSARQIDLDQTLSFEGLQYLVAAHFAVVEPKGM